MGIRVELEMLAVLLLLTPIVTDGLVFEKCDLANQVLSQLPPDMADRDIQTAKLVCHVEQTSKFDTSLVQQVAGQEIPVKRKRRAAPQKPAPKPADTNNKAPPKPNAVDNKPPAKPNAVDNKPPAKPIVVDNKPLIKPSGIDNKPPRKPNAIDTKPLPPKIEKPVALPPQNPPNPNPQAEPQNPAIINQSSELKPQNPDALPPPTPVTRYGLFQLSDNVTCTSGKPSLNLCNLDCTMLTDNDITDDIKCVSEILNSKPRPDAQDSASQLIKSEIDRLTTCVNVDLSNYITGCINP